VTFNAGAGIINVFPAIWFRENQHPSRLRQRLVLGLVNFMLLILLG